MTEFTWNIVNLDSIVDTGLVTNCAWICRCKNGEFEGSSTLSEIDPSSPDFIPYPNLTEEVVLQWLFSLLGDEKAVDGPRGYHRQQSNDDRVGLEVHPDDDRLLLLQIGHGHLDEVREYDPGQPAVPRTAR